MRVVVDQHPTTVLARKLKLLHQPLTIRYPKPQNPKQGQQLLRSHHNPSNPVLHEVMEHNQNLECAVEYGERVQDRQYIVFM